jgi:hypothetical protein
MLTYLKDNFLFLFTYTCHDPFIIITQPVFIKPRSSNVCVNPLLNTMLITNISDTALPRSGIYGRVATDTYDMLLKLVTHINGPAADVGKPLYKSNRNQFMYWCPALVRPQTPRHTMPHAKASSGHSTWNAQCHVNKLSVGGACL